MRYHEPGRVDEVIAILRSQPQARCVAGGATLVVAQACIEIAGPHVRRSNAAVAFEAREVSPELAVTGH